MPQVLCARGPTFHCSTEVQHACSVEQHRVFLGLLCLWWPSKLLTGLPAKSLSSTNSEIRPLYSLSSASTAADLITCFLSVHSLLTA